MDIDSIHFYVRDADHMRDWAVEQMGLQILAQEDATDPTTLTYRVGTDRFWLTISSPLDAMSPVAEYLRYHPPGVKAIDFRVSSLDAMRRRLDRLQIEPLATSAGSDRSTWLKVKGWGAIEHTLIESPDLEQERNDESIFTDIDHLVLNVAAGELTAAVDWYQNLFDFRIHQTFDIQTQNSGLSSKALISSDDRVRFNINEPSSPNSQIQEFLDANGGAGIQHIALHTDRILTTVAALQQQGLTFLSIPHRYYAELKAGTDRGAAVLLTSDELRTLERLNILADWSQEAPDALLMQIFTQPIFPEPTFFFEVIERRNRAQGFGKGNFQALFEAVESYNEQH